MLKTVLFMLCFVFSGVSFAEKNNTQPEQLNFYQQFALHKGKVIYLDFWASWCTPCRKSFPWMNEVQAKLAGDDFTVLSVNLDTERRLADQFLKENPASFPVIYDPEGILAEKYQLLGMPSSFLIGRDGKVKKSHVGFLTQNKKQYETDILMLISNKEPITPQRSQ